jgi:DNA polymerase I-like protein with 3'-5' exonuclease and polymerase domains
MVAMLNCSEIAPLVLQVHDELVFELDKDLDQGSSFVLPLEHTIDSLVTAMTTSVVTRLQLATTLKVDYKVKEHW